MIVAKSISECRSSRKQFGRLALVPTMGALHQGHVSLIEIARKHAEHVAVSIFVNPTQFGPREDFQKYPRPIESDLEKCAAAGVDFVFNPSESDMYPPGGMEIHLDIPALSGILEGRVRPNHFKGVCQVVAKLFNVITPDVACFGQKDFQQLRILTVMTEALNWPIQIVPCPTIREPDGLAMSSRNQYLSTAERQRALLLSRALFFARSDFQSGVRQTNRLITAIQNMILEGGAPGRIPITIDYIAAVDAMTLKNVEAITAPTVLAVAARVGATRLIDNVILTP
jgi:pantoate--beta-alanine ligase